MMDTSFSKVIQFPSFYRSNELFEVDGIVRLLRHFGWRWVGLIVSDDDTGYRASKVLKEEIESDGGCVAFIGVMHNPLEMRNGKLISNIPRTTANVIVLFLITDYIELYLHVFHCLEMPPKVWILPSLFAGKTMIKNSKCENIFNGAFSISADLGEIQSFHQFFYDLRPYRYPDDVLMAVMRWVMYSCSAELKQTPTDHLRDRCPRTEPGFGLQAQFEAYPAIYMVTQSLYEMYVFKDTRYHTKNRPGVVEQTNFMVWLFNVFMQHVVKNTSTGDSYFFREKRDGLDRLDIVQWIFPPKKPFVKKTVGKFYVSESQENCLYIINSSDLWTPFFSKFPQSLCNEPCPPGYRKSKIQGAQSCCYDCIRCVEGEMSNTTDAPSCFKCPAFQRSNSQRDGCVPKYVKCLSYEEPLGTSLASAALLLSVTCAVIQGIFIKYRETPIVRANNRYLSCLLLISLMLCFLCTLLFIGRPTQICCLLRQVTFGIVFTISVSSVLAKTLTVIIAFNATKPRSKLKKYVGTQLAIVLVIVCSLGETVISIVWMASNPPFPDTDDVSNVDSVILLCNEGSIIYFFSVISYMGMLALLSFIAAFLAKDFPDRFNEAMLGFCSVWGAFVPAYLSSKGSRMVAVEIFAILSSSAGLLACIFIPKCYIIFLRPELNTKANRII
uniref:G-protein coupled receptors family 3 profile domain-containing protein n=1 Tax=Xenopus tropicalis TaxID=8364 RepID=A0A1B8YAR0_XENTR